MKTAHEWMIDLDEYSSRESCITESEVKKIQAETIHSCACVCTTNTDKEAVLKLLNDI